MHLALSDEQGFLAEAASGVLARQDTLGNARAALDGAPAPYLWGLATEAGWPGLLIGEDADGAGLGAYEAMLVLEACGAALADARLLGHLSASALLELADGHAELRASLASGERRAALVDGLRSVHTRPKGDAAVVHGEVSSVLDAAAADVLVVIGLGLPGA